MARKLLETWPDEAMPHIIVATVAIKQRRYDAALAALDGIGADTFEDITGSILKAWALTGQGKIDDAHTNALAGVDKAQQSISGARDSVQGLRDAADQSQAVRAVDRQRSEQAVALRAAEGAYDIAQRRYKGGLGTYLDVLTAETAVLAQRRTRVDLAARAVDAQIGLAHAMGGGWQPSPELTPPSAPGASAQP